MKRPSPRWRLGLAAAAVTCGLVPAAAFAGFPHPPTVPPRGVLSEPPVVVVDPPEPPPPPPPPDPMPQTPEPGTLVLGLIGAGVAALAARRKKRRAE
jgi:hypothetical protein